MADSCRDIRVIEKRVREHVNMITCEHDITCEHGNKESVITQSNISERRSV